MLTSRREAVLKIIVQEYIDRGMPVASETISHNYRLGVSPATIRNDMAYLEEARYITRPHVSAGAVPLTKAYRYYVGSLAEDIELPLAEQRFIGNLFQEVEGGFEEWTKLAATLLSRLMQTMAIVTPPKAPQCRFKHIELIGFQDFLVLLVLVLHQAKLKRQFLSVATPLTQEELTRLANRLNFAYTGLTTSEILAKELEFSPLEKQIVGTMVNLMVAEDELEYDEPHFEGLRLMLSQPEFASSDQMLSIMELVEERGWLPVILPQRLAEGEVKVVIGEESQEELLRDLSLIFTRYGIPHGVSGTIGVIGPTRMDYSRAIPTVRYLSEVLSGLVAEVYHYN